MGEKVIVLTGGGSAGHVTPNLAILERLLEKGWKVHYIGTEKGIESSIVPKDKVLFHTIKAGKLRRYFDIKNFTDPFNVLAGAAKSFFILRKIKPSVVFAKGGFVSLPVIFSAWLLGIPAITHEGDVSLGLANKLSLFFVKKVCVSFKETLESVGGKCVYTGLPVRKEILHGNAEQGYEFCNLKDDKPVILIMGGSQGSRRINDLIVKSLPQILSKFNVVHICGKGNMNHSVKYDGYRQFEYIGEELPHIFAISSVVVSRSGTSAIFEILSLKKPSVLIPLMVGSRGEQVLNARNFEKSNFARMISENNITTEEFCSTLHEVYENRQFFIDNMMHADVPDSIEVILDVIEGCSKQRKRV
ncbi:MAG: undecaprenyldiphospho-muramoylpentapeptide beta-N-acetylglucosaminyltransferase [Bacillota bacterium]